MIWVFSLGFSARGVKGKVNGHSASLDLFSLTPPSAALTRTPIRRHLDPYGHINNDVSLH